MLLAFSIAFKFCEAQTKDSNTDTLLVGTWKGTSICQLKNSPCHDEVVVYRITKKSSPNTYSIDARKVVNGIEEEMGILTFVYVETSHQLTSSDYGTWTFNVEAARLEGTLVHRGDLYRIIKLVKQ